MIPPVIINSDECLDTSRNLLNSNFGLFNESITVLESTQNSITTLVNTISSAITAPNNILQIVTSRVNLNENIITEADTPLPTAVFPQQGVQIVRKSPTSKILIELTGGRFKYSRNEGAFTYIYVRPAPTSGLVPSNYRSVIEDNTNNPIPLEAISPPYSLEGQHNIQYLYTPGNDTTLQFRVYAERYVTSTKVIWNTSDGIVPFILTLTEITT
jgi:hypothetical protein